MKRRGIEVCITYMVIVLLLYSISAMVISFVTMFFVEFEYEFVLIAGIVYGLYRFNRFLIKYYMGEMRLLRSKSKEAP